MKALVSQAGLGLLELMVLMILLALAASIWFTGIDTDQSEAQALVTIKSTQLVSQYVYLYGIAQGELPTHEGDCADGYQQLANRIGAHAWQSEPAYNGWLEPLNLSCNAEDDVVIIRQRIPRPELVGFLLEHLPYSQAYLSQAGDEAVLETHVQLEFPRNLNLLEEVSLKKHSKYALAELSTKRFCRKGTVTYSAQLSALCTPPEYDKNDAFIVLGWRLKDNTKNPNKKISYRISADIREQKESGSFGAVQSITVDSACRPNNAPTQPVTLTVMAFCDHKLR